VHRFRERRDAEDGQIDRVLPRPRGQPMASSRPALVDRQRPGRRISSRHHARHASIRGRRDAAAARGHGPVGRRSWRLRAGHPVSLVLRDRLECSTQPRQLERSVKACADVAQLVEHHLAKVRVAGSNPVVRSEAPTASTGPRSASPGPTGGVAEWLRQGPAKPCTRVRFPPPPRRRRPSTASRTYGSGSVRFHTKGV